MAKEIKNVSDIHSRKITISDTLDVALAGKIAATTAYCLGFERTKAEEIHLVTRELAANIVRHARSGFISISVLVQSTVVGIEIEALDAGPGIKDIARAMEDGFSSCQGKGYGLGSADRFSDHMEIQSPLSLKGGTRIVCYFYLHSYTSLPQFEYPLEVGVATRSLPGTNVNGDSFVICKSSQYAVVSVIDGLGHGQFAYNASQIARSYIERHHERNLSEILRGVSRNCRCTRGVVIAVARIYWDNRRIYFTGIGNVEARLIQRTNSTRLAVRRGIVGGVMPHPVTSSYDFKDETLLVLHTDGVSSRWQKTDILPLQYKRVQDIAEYILATYNKHNDDATVMVVRGKCHGRNEPTEGVIGSS